MVERERKFLVSCLPDDVRRYVRDSIRQGYLAIESDGDFGEVAEVEFNSDHAMQRFAAPPWFGKEITGCKKFANSRIAQFGWK